MPARTIWKTPKRIQPRRVWDEIDEWAERFGSCLGCAVRAYVPEYLNDQETKSSYYRRVKKAGAKNKRNRAARKKALRRGW